ncbi:hypothetical protein WJX74_010395 [Apatococcus lobatus]|uniref:Strictosidine synthase conserved region domain-containing protein n=2 Tax=Apatococcus TaxID=904362 RepID=A0AAW1T2C4_9CHLO
MATERVDLPLPGPSNPSGNDPSSNTAARTPSSVRPPKPRILGPVYRLVPAALVLAVATAFSAKRILPNSTLEVQQIPSDKLTQPAPLEGVLAANNRLFSSSAQKIFEGVNGSETISFGPDGAQYGSDDRGIIWKADAGSSKPQPIAYMGGRPLGHMPDGKGNLIMADGCKGLVSLNLETGLKTLLTNSVDDAASFSNTSEIKYANDLDIASDGTIYFSDSSVVAPPRSADGKCDTYAAFMQTYYHGASTGRLLSYNPATGKTKALATGIFYANGVALSQDESYVLLAETGALRILRIWLSGPKAGQQEIFATNIPGMPDGISRGPGGTFWVAIVARPPAAFLKIRSWPTLRWLCAWLPPSWLPKPVPYGLVLQVNEQGQVLQSLHDPTGKHAFSISAVHEHDGKLYLGSLAAPYMLALSL